MQRRKGVGMDMEGLVELKGQKPKNGDGAKPGRDAKSPAVGLGPNPEIQSLLRRFEKAVRSQPADAANWFRLGNLLLDLGESRRAEAMLNQAARREPYSANYRFYLGDALGNNGKLVKAANHFRSLASVDPELSDPMSVIGLSALSHLAYCQGGMGDWDAAFTTLQPATRMAISILSDLETFLSKSGDYDRACFLFTVALFLAPDDAGLLHGTGYCHMKAGRLEQAVERLRKAAKANRDNPNIWYDLGLTLVKMRNGKKARPCFRRVLELDAKYFWAWYDLACLDALDKKPNAAFWNLYKSVECGFKDKEYLLRDSDFADIRKDPRWKLVLECISDKDSSKNSDQGPQPQSVKDLNTDATLG